MSEFTKQAIYRALCDDAALVGLLGVDEDGRPAIYNANFNQATADHDSLASDAGYPCVTFREGAGSADPRFLRSTVDSEVFDIEVWARTSSALTVPRIATALDRILHNRRLELDSGKNYDCVRISQIPDQHDEKLALHFGLYRYRLVVKR